MIRKLLVAAVAAAGLVSAGAAFAEVLPQGPEPYTAPDPVYTPHKIESTVTMKNDEAPTAATDSSDSGSSTTPPHG